MSQIARLSLSPKTPETAEPEAGVQLKGAQQRLGFVPNMYANMANSPGLLATYLSGYDQFRSESGFSPAEQEVVFLAISRFNGCTYCMAAHSMIAEKMSKVPSDVLGALRADNPLPDPKLNALARFTRILVENRGRPSPQDLSAFLAAGFQERHVLEIILAIAVKTLSNYSNHVFDTRPDPAFATYAWTPPAGR